MHLGTGCHPVSVLITLTVIKNQGVTGERSRERKQISRHRASHIGYCKHNCQKILQNDSGLQDPLFHATPQWHSTNKGSPAELLPLPENLTGVDSISLFWFCKISSCLKPQDAKVADDQYNDIAKCRVNQPLIPGHSWVPITHTDEYQPAWKSTWNDQRKRGEDISTDHKNQAFTPFIWRKHWVSHPDIGAFHLSSRMFSNVQVTISTAPKLWWVKQAECAWDKSQFS